MIGRDRVNKCCGRCGGGVVLQPRVPKAALAFERRQPQGPLQTGGKARGGRDGSCSDTVECSVCSDTCRRRYGATVESKEDDHGDHGQCGGFYCGECNVTVTMGQIANCPTCRAPFNTSTEVYVERPMRLLRRSPGRHTPMAQYNLALMYAGGAGVPQDYTEASRWNRLAADQGLAVTQSNLGLMYDDGTGVPQDHTEAVRWYRLAADQGLAVTQSNLGLMYDDGTGVSQDHTEAVRWYRLAADQGHAEAQRNLEAMHKNGTGAAWGFATAAP